METTPQKGISKGCLIGLIVVLAVVVVLIAIMVLGYIFKDDLVKVGTNATVAEIKKVLAENPPEGIDTVRFNALADAFVEKVGLDTTASFETLGLFVQQVTEGVRDKQVDSHEVEAAAAAMIALYPDLLEYWKVVPESSPVEPSDSLSEN